MTEVTPERRRLDAWSAANPRDNLAMIAIAAWLNVPVEKVPPHLALHTCEASKAAWQRVSEALCAKIQSIEASELESAFAEGFADGYGGGWIEGDYTRAWERSNTKATLE